MSTLTVVALTHQRAPFAVLERVTLTAKDAGRLAADVHAAGDVDEVVVVSTCNRTEVYVAATSDCASAVVDHLAIRTGIDAADFHSCADVHHGDAASLHLFRVAAGLESRVVGEGEILGQVRASVARAVRHGTSGPTLNTLFQWAAATGRRARRDAGDASRPSLARTALDAADHRGGRTLVLGAGAMAAAVAGELQATHRPYRVATRRVERAVRLTRQPEDALGLGDLDAALVEANVVVCATGARTTIVGADAVSQAMGRRAGKPMVIVDLSMPRNVDPTVAAIGGVTLIHLQELSGGHGELQVRKTSEVVAAEHDAYRRWLAARAAGPVITALRRRVTAICVSEVERHLGPDSGAFAHRLAGQILHAPTLAVKDLSSRGATDALEALAFVFNLLDADERTQDLQVAS